MILIVLAYAADLIFGDPEWMPHPVRWIGRLISFTEEKLRRPADSGRMARLKGIALVGIVVGATMFCAWFFITLMRSVHPVLGDISWIYAAYTALAVKDLRVKAREVYRALQKGDLHAARNELSKIVGRDTDRLDEEGITKAAVESVAESTSDGIIAPLLYLIIGGPVLALGYKAVNTLDSMVGHRDERYIDFGWCAARLDDAANFIPARLSGFLIACASWSVGNGFEDSWKILRRDGRKHNSPNSGIPEAAMAGALGVKLGGPATYAGEVIEKPYIGESVRMIERSMIPEALTISFISSLLMVVLGMAVIWRLQ